jgi:hypothetical protein
MLKSLGNGLLITFLLCPNSVAQSKTVSFHVAPVAGKFDRFSFHYVCQPEQLSWKIDTRKPVRWSQEAAVEVVGLDADQRHLVAVICDGKPLEAFRFRFSEFKDKDLCLYFDPWEGAQVVEEKRASGYTCK